MKRQIFIIQCLFFVGIIFAQTPHNLYFNHLLNDDSPKSLSQTSNSFIYTDSKGIIWISSISGLNKFDGKTVEIFEPVQGDSTSINGWNIQGNIDEDDNGNIWFCTNEAINRYNRKLGNFSSFKVKENGAGYFSLGLDAADNFYFFYENNLYQYHILENTFQKLYEYPEPFNRGILQINQLGKVNRVYSFNVDQSGIFEYDLEHPINSGHIRYDNRTKKQSKVYNIYSSSSQRPFIWIGTADGLAKYNVSNNTFISLNQYQGQEIGLVYGITKGIDDGLILATSKKGILFFDTKSAWFSSNIRHSASNTASILQNNVSNIYVDRLGNIWLSYVGKGVSFSSLKKSKFIAKFSKQNATSSESSEIFNTIIATDKNYWASTFSNGILILDEHQQVINRINQKKYPNLPSDAINYIFKDDQNRIWILTWQGLCYYDLTTNQVKRLPNFNNQVYLFGCQLKNGTILFSSIKGGIYQLVNNDLVLLKNIDSTKAYVSFYEGENDLLYANIDLESLNIIDVKDTLKLLESLPIKGDYRCFYEAPNDSILWIGSSYGLVKLNKRTKQFRHITKKDGLPNSNVYGILPDDANNLWLSTNLGIARFNLANESIQTYGLADGLSALEFNTLSYFKRPNGELWFGSIDGLTIIPPEEVHSKLPLPNIVLSSIKVEGLAKENLKCAKTGALNPDEIEQLVLDYNQNTISFEFAALEYSNPDKNQFRYRMKNLDGHWSEATTQGNARYPKLKPGLDTFQIIAANSDGVWNPEPKNIEVIITPPFWQTWWFYLLSFCALIGSTWWLATLYQRRKEHLQNLAYEKKIAFEKVQRLESESKLSIEKERVRIANNLHDSLGSGFSALKLNVEVLLSKITSVSLTKSFETIIKDTHSLSEELTDAIFVLNPKNDTLFALLSYLHEYSINFFENAPTECVFLLPKQIESVMIAGKKRHEILLSFKEALNNVLKHAQASEVHISFTSTTQFFSIMIKDNGIGFDNEHQNNALGNGLRSMQNRMDKIDGSYQITSNSSGTEVQLSFPI